MYKGLGFRVYIGLGKGRVGRTRWNRRVIGRVLAFHSCTEASAPIAAKMKVPGRAQWSRVMCAGSKHAVKQCLGCVLCNALCLMSSEDGSGPADKTFTCTWEFLVAVVAMMACLFWMVVAEAQVLRWSWCCVCLMISPEYGWGRALFSVLLYFRLRSPPDRCSASGVYGNVFPSVSPSPSFSFSLSLYLSTCSVPCRKKEELNRWKSHEPSFSMNYWNPTGWALLLRLAWKCLASALRMEIVFV